METIKIIVRLFLDDWFRIALVVVLRPSSIINFCPRKWLGAILKYKDVLWQSMAHLLSNYASSPKQAFLFQQFILCFSQPLSLYLFTNMHLFSFAFAFAGVCYAIFEQQSLIVYFGLVIASYIAISMFYPGAKDISIRKKIMLGTWSDPNEGVIVTKVPVRTEKV